ncbi:MAG: hypothetical protein ACLGIC_09065 [Acidimicrobiia bacterium]
MADVQLIRWALVAVAALKVVDVVLRDDPAVLALGWLAAAVAGARAPRAGCLAIAAMGATSNLFLEASNHTTLVLWAGLLVAVLRPVDVPDVARLLVVVVYAFATANKLLFGHFLDGGYIAARFFWEGAPFRLMAIGAVVGQLTLAVLVALRLRLAIPLSVLLHVGIVVTMSSELAHVLRLGGFNGLMVVLVVVATRNGPWYPLPARPVARPGV